MEVPDFLNLAGQFSQGYNKFSSSYQASNYQKDTGEPCFVTMGITGAGKSSFVKRLTESLSAPEFCSIMSGKIEDSNSEIEIGHGKSSKTIIPTIHHSNSGFYICDMPGFIDTDKRNYIVIDMLQRFMLTRLKNPQFIFIIDSRKFKENRFESVIHNYVPHIERITQSAFDYCCSHAVYLVTHIDQSGLVEEEIKELIRSAIVDLSSSKNESCLFFMSQMIQNMMLVDYRIVTQQELQKRLLNKHSAIEKNISKSKIISGDLTLEKLSSSGNQFDEACSKQSTWINSCLLELQKKVDRIKVDQESLTRSQNEDIRAIGEEFSKIQVEIQKAEEKYHKTLSRSESLPGLIEEAKKTRDSCDHRVKTNQSLMVHLKQELDLQNPCQKRVDTSRLRKVGLLSSLFGSNQVHEVAVSIPRATVGESYRVLIVKDTENLDSVDLSQSFEKIIKKLDSLPSSSTLHNSGSNHTSTNCQVSIQNTGERLNIEASHDSAFNVITISSPEKESSLPKSKQLIKLVADSEAELQTLDQKWQDLIKESEQIKAQLIAQRSQMTKLTNELKDLKAEAFALKKKHNDQLEEILKKMVSLINNELSSKMLSSIGVLESVANIYDENRIVSEWCPLARDLVRQATIMENTRTDFTSLIKTCKKNVTEGSQLLRSNAIWRDA